MSTIPSKAYFRIGEVAGLLDVEPHVLRYWEREFQTVRPQKSAKGQRVYSRHDVEQLLRVKKLLYAEGFTIAGAKKKLRKLPESGEEAARGDTHPGNSVNVLNQLHHVRRELEAALMELRSGRWSAPAIQGSE